MIEREESLDADRAAAEDFVVKVCAEFLKVFETLSNWLSRETRGQERLSTVISFVRKVSVSRVGQWEGGRR
jgi:hypothetical protein